MFKFQPRALSGLTKRATGKFFQNAKLAANLSYAKINLKPTNGLVSSSNSLKTNFGFSAIQHNSILFTSKPTGTTKIRFFASASDKTIKVPPMGDSITEGTVQKWHKKIGDPVQTDDIVATIETDKVNVDIRAPEPGVIKEIFGEAGATVRVGADLFKLDTSAQPQATPKPVEQKKRNSSTKNCCSI